MKINKKNKYQILSRVEFDQSYIEDISIETTEEVNPQTGEVFEKPSDEIYDYVFYFNTDLRKALNSGLMKLRLTVRASLNKNVFELFGQMGDASPRDIIAALYGKGKDNRTESFEADLQGIIHRSAIPLESFFNSQKLQNASNLTDRNLFGTIKKTVLVSAKEAKKLGKNAQLAQKQLTSIESDYVNSDGFGKNYSRSFTLGVDPMSFFFPALDETPADSRKEGCVYSTDIKSGNRCRDEVMFSLRSNILGTSGEQTNPDRNSIENSQSSDVVAITRTVPNIVRMIPFRVKIKKSEITSQNKDFFLVVDVIDKSGKIGQSLPLIIKHSNNVEDFYAPRSGVDSNISFSFDSHKKNAKIVLKKNDPNIVGCDIYIRSLCETRPIGFSGFKNSTRIMFKSSNIKNKKTEITLPFVEEKMSIMRAVPVTKTGSTFGNFSSSVKKNGPFVRYLSGVYTKPAQDGIIVSAKTWSPNVASICFERRDITRSEKNFTRIISPLFTEPNNEVLTHPVPLNMLDNSLSFSVLDRDIIPNHLYEYRARLYLEEGVVSRSQVSRFETFVTPMNLISVKINRKTVQLTTTVEGRAESSARPIKISFTPTWEMASTDADKIKDGLSAAGFSDLWSDDQEALKNSLRNLIFFDVQRFNLRTGETFYLGSFPENTVISDDGVTTDALCPVTGMAYLYRVTPILVSPTVAYESIAQQTDIESVVWSSGDLRNPSTYSKLRQATENIALLEYKGPAELIESFQVGKVNKNYSKSSLTRGTLSLNTTYILTEFSTGDYVEFPIDTSAAHDLSISGKSVGYSVNTGPVLRWSLRGSNSSSRFSVDSFIVLCKKQGRKCLAGTCHKVDGDSFLFADFSNKDYVGMIRYSIIPVFLDGARGSEVQMGSAIMPDRSKVFRRGN